MQKVQIGLIPFNLERETVEVSYGLNLQEIVDQLIPKPVQGSSIVVALYGEIINPALWKRIRPHKNALISINVIPEGGKGKGKNPLAAILSLAITIAAPYAAGAVWGTTMFATQAAALAVRAATAFAISAVGRLAVSALFSTPKQNSGAGQNASSVKESPTQFIEGASNQILKYGIIPANLGTNRMFPPQAALPYTETLGTDQYVRQLFTYGYGEVVVSDRKIGDTPITEFTNYEIQEKLAGDLSDGTELYANDTNQQGYSVALLFASGWITRRTPVDIDEFELDVTFTDGLIAYEEDGEKSSVLVEFEIRYQLVGSGIWSTPETLRVYAATTRVFREVYRTTVPTRGEYDVSIRRTGGESSGGQGFRDAPFLTSIRSTTYVNPVNQSDISGFALRMKATDQLNGTIEKINDIVSTICLDYDVDTDTWIERATSNPASLYRYVLQSPAFAKALPDNEINLTKLKEWHVYCETMRFTFNRVIDYETSVDGILEEICAAGFATKHSPFGIYGVIIDNERPYVKGMVTPRNSWDYSGSISYPDVPHAFRVEFRNAEKGYAIDEVIVYSNGYDINTATKYERLEFSSCTNSDLAYYYGYRYLVTLATQVEVHTFSMDFENLSFNRGDRILLVDDTILVGVGSGRIKSLNDDGTYVTSFTLDDEVTIPSSAQFGVRIRHADASGFIYYPLNTVVGATRTFTFLTPVLIADAPGEGSLCSFTEFGKELDLLVTEVRINKDHSAKITATNYAPERFDPIGVIPTHESNITLPFEMYRPTAPILNGTIQSDESVMLRNSDGSYLTRMIIPIRNDNIGLVETLVKIRKTNTTVWFNPEILSVTSDAVVLTGLDDGVRYDIEIRYQRKEGQQLVSLPLVLNSTKYVGASTNPSTVTGFKVTVSGLVGLFEWAPNADIDISGYVMRFNKATTGVTWNNSSALVENITTNRITLPIQEGTYLIKAVDILGNESDSPTLIISYDKGEYRNTVETLTQETAWNGVKDNVQVLGDRLYLIDLAQVGYYYFDPEPFDLSEVYKSTLSSNIISSGNIYNRIRSIASIRGEASIRGVPAFTIRSLASIRSQASMRGVEASNWSVELEVSYSTDNAIYTDWEPFRVGEYIFRYVKFRLVLRSFDENTNPTVYIAEITIDMPDRVEFAEDITCPVGGVTITYPAAFKNNPSVQITLQDGAEGDIVEYVAKSSTGFTIKVYNTVSSTYVERILDYTSNGYGRIL